MLKLNRELHAQKPPVAMPVQFKWQSLRSTIVSKRVSSPVYVLQAMHSDSLKSTRLEYVFTVEANAFISPCHTRMAN